MKRRVTGEPANRRKDDYQLGILEAAFDEQPYPDMQVKRRLAHQTDLSAQQVESWFGRQRQERGIAATSNAEYICQPPTWVAAQRRRDAEAAAAAQEAATAAEEAARAAETERARRRQAERDRREAEQEVRDRLWAQHRAREAHARDEARRASAAVASENLELLAEKRGRAADARDAAVRADLRALEDRDARLRALAPDVPPNLAHKLPPSMRPATADAKQLRDARLYAHNAVAAGRPRTASAVHARNSSLRAGLIG